MEIAKTIAYEGYISEIEIVGLRSGEKLNEDLISETEIDYTYIEDDMIYIYNEENKGNNKLTEGYSSANAEQMDVEEMKELIWNTK